MKSVLILCLLLSMQCLADDFVISQNYNMNNDARFLPTQPLQLIDVENFRFEDGHEIQSSAAISSACVPVSNDLGVTFLIVTDLSGQEYLLPYSIRQVHVLNEFCSRKIKWSKDNNNAVFQIQLGGKYYSVK